MPGIEIKGRSKIANYRHGGRTGKFGGGRTDLLEELGRVEGERSNPNRRAEISRVHGELNRGYAKGGRAGFEHGKQVEIPKDKKTEPSGRGFPVYKQNRRPGKERVKKAEGGKSDKNWIQKATKGMVKTKPCTGKKFGSKSCPPGSKRYNLAKTFKKMGRERKAKG